MKRECIEMGSYESPQIEETKITIELGFATSVVPTDVEELEE